MAVDLKNHIFGEQPSREPNWQGKWFTCYGWRLFPRRLKKKVDARIRANRDRYEDQFDWSIKDYVRAGNERQALEIAEEFLRASRHASYNCPLLFDVDAKDLEKHAWKHFTFEDLERLGQKALNRPRIVSPEEMDIPAIRDLFSRAIGKEALAVAVITRWLPHKVERYKKAKLYMGRRVLIPSVGDLASEYIETIYRDPKSTDAKSARRGLTFLLSPEAISGIPVKRGRSTKPRNPISLYEAYFIAQALARQLSEIAHLVDFEKDPKKRFQFLTGLCPWLRNVRVDRAKPTLPRLLEMYPSQAAPWILRPIVDIGPRTVEKIISRHRSFKLPQK